MITFVYCCICLLIACYRTTGTQGEDYMPENLPEGIVLRQRIGTNISMKCNNHHQHNTTNITWEFKQCDSTLADIRCDEKTDWQTIDFNKNKRKLEIRNIKEVNVGLYRCLCNNSVIKTYVVEVSDAQNLEPPKVLSLTTSSDSSVVLPNTTLVMHCEATSVIPTHIQWFKVCNGGRCGVAYNGQCYCKVLSRSFPHSENNHVYHSKLKIYSLKKIDSGVYVCLAISENGNDFKNITITVQGSNVTEETRKSFSLLFLLFLIPLCFVLVPVSIWLCFYRRKRKSRRDLGDHQKHLLKPVVKFDIVLEVDKV